MHQAIKHAQHSIKWKWYIQDRAQVVPEGTSELHKEGAHLRMIPTPTTRPSLSQPALMASWVVHYGRLAEEEKP